MLRLVLPDEALNRTIVGWKFRRLISRRERPGALNRTIVGWKFGVEKGDLDDVEDFKSHHSGMEIPVAVLDF